MHFHQPIFEVFRTQTNCGTILAGHLPARRDAPYMNLEWTKTADWHVARFIHQNLNDCDAESRAINSFIESLPTGSKVAISFRGIEWVSSRVLGLIMAAKTAVAKRNGQFAITSPSEKIMEVLKITKLHKVLTIKKSTSELG